MTETKKTDTSTATERPIRDDKGDYLDSPFGAGKPAPKHPGE